ncbi:MAG: mechanosensitive ion channel family protein [Spirochaetaceae bacterium]|jgi:small-conductance mechanosensitive channel|nr:mechanosensitive ion channel family protein [Spirochaetaceae bacterium]
MNTSEITEFIEDILRRIDSAGPRDLLLRIISAFLMVFVIIIVFNLIQIILGKFLKNRFSVQRTFMIRKAIKYTGFVMALLFLFKSIGIDTSALLGAAGIVGIAVGFAAQTSVSSFISGLFLLSEKPFQVGDAIIVDTFLGVVLSVDLLSVKIRTFDNLYVRIPNETIFKSNVTTLTRFPIRRLDLIFNVTYQADLEQVRDVLLDVAAKDPYVLDNPAPLFRVDQFDRAGPLIIFNVWFDKNFILETKTSMYMGIKKRFDEERIELPCQKVDIRVRESIGDAPEDGVSTQTM